MDVTTPASRCAWILAHSVNVHERHASPGMCLRTICSWLSSICLWFLCIRCYCYGHSASSGSLSFENQSGASNCTNTLRTLLQIQRLLAKKHSQIRGFCALEAMRQLSACSLLSRLGTHCMLATGAQHHYTHVPTHEHHHKQKRLVQLFMPFRKGIKRSRASRLPPRVRTCVAGVVLE